MSSLNETKKKQSISGQASESRRRKTSSRRAWTLLMSMVLLVASIGLVSGRMEAAGTTIDAAKLKSISRLYFPMRDERNQLYTLYIFADNEKRSVTSADEIWAGASEGDVIYSGKYRAALLKSGEKTGRIQGVNLNYTTLNATRNESFRIPGDGKTRPDLVFLSATATSNLAEVYGFVITGGVLHSLDFASEKGAKWGKDGYISPGGMRALSENRIQTRAYNNAIGQYYFNTYKLNLKSLTLQHIDDLYASSDKWPSKPGMHTYLDSLKQSAIKHALPSNPQVKIGMTEKQVRSIMGKPSQVTNGEWSGYLVYGDNWIGFNDYANGSKLPAGVKVWELSQDLNFYLDPGQVREWLGKPSDEYWDEEQEAYMMVYRWNDAMLTFVYADESSPISIFTLY